MVKIKEIMVKTLEEALEEQNYMLEENENYTFRVIEVFLDGYCLEVYKSKEESLYDLLNGFYNSFKDEVEKLEKINNNNVKQKETLMIETLSANEYVVVENCSIGVFYNEC